MRLTITTFLTLDGVMQSPGGKEEDASDGFELGGWLVPYGDEDMGRIVTEQFADADAFLLGRKTYRIMQGFWPDVTNPDDVVATKLNTLPKYVVSSTLTHPSWVNTTVIGGDLAAEVARLKAMPGGELQVHGSGQLGRSLHDMGLIDEYRLWIFPVVLGTGLRLFPEGVIPAGFEVASAATTSTGVSVLTLLPAGPPVLGGLAIEDGKEVSR